MTLGEVPKTLPVHISLMVVRPFATALYEIGLATLDQQSEFGWQRLRGPAFIDLASHRARLASALPFVLPSLHWFGRPRRMRVVHSIKRAIGLGLLGNLRLAEAVTALAGAAASIKFRSFRNAVSFGSVPLRRKIDLSAGAIDDLSWSVRTTAKKVPFRALCFEQGLALQRMLRRRGIDARLHYGIGKPDAKLIEAHVWVNVGDKVVIGEQGQERFQSVAIFP